MSNMDLAWWITAVEAPIVGALIAEFKLDVARTYVPLSLIRDVDRRLSQALLRIEEKLDEAARNPRRHGEAG